MLAEDSKPTYSGLDKASAQAAQEILAQLDNSGLSRFHLKAMITSGMGLHFAWEGEKSAIFHPPRQNNT